MGLPDGIRRRQFDIADGERTPDDEYESIRVYHSPHADAPPMPSVSVIKNLRDDPDKEHSLEGWRDRYDGKSSWARPWYKDQKYFKGYRGTLVHFTILSALAEAHGDITASGETYFHKVGDSGYGYEEYYAEYCLKKWSTKAPSANTDEIGFVPRGNKYDGEHAWDRAVRDMKWAARAFKENVIDNGRLSPSNVLAVEDYVFETEHGYGGQYDLLYEYEDDGERKTVLADLKTSSGIRYDHRLQCAAYKSAVESHSDVTIDECEIIQVHPDSETVNCSRSPEWDRSLGGLQYEFYALADKAWNVSYSETLQRAKEQIESEHAQGSQTKLDASSD